MNIDSPSSYQEPNHAHFEEKYLENLHAEPDIKKQLVNVNKQIKALNNIDWSHPDSPKSQKAIKVLSENFGMHDLNTKLRKGISPGERKSLQYEVKETLDFLKATKENLCAELNNADQGDASVKRKRDDTEIPKQAPDIKRPRTTSEYEQFLHLFPSHDQDEQLSNLINKQLSFLDASDKMILKEVISATPEANRKQTLIFLSHTLTEEVPHDQRATALRFIQEEIPAHERESFIHLAILCFSGHLNLSEKAEILTGIKTMTSDQRAGMVETLELVPLNTLNHKETEDLILVVVKLAYVDKDLRTSALQFAQSFFTEGMSIADKAKILIDIKDSDLKILKKLLTGVGKNNPDQRAAVIEIMKWISPLSKSFNASLSEVTEHVITLYSASNGDLDDIKNVIKYAFPLLTQRMDNDEKKFILETIQKIPIAEREEVNRLAQSCFTQEMGGWDKIQLFINIARVKPEQRAATVEIMKLLFPDITHFQYILDTAHKLVNLDKDERSDIIRFVQSLPPLQNGHRKHEILSGILLIPPQERDAFIQKIGPIIPILAEQRTGPTTLLLLYLLPDNLDLKAIVNEDPGAMDIKKYHNLLVSSLQRISVAEENEIIRIIQRFTGKEASIENKILFLTVMGDFDSDSREKIVEIIDIFPNVMTTESEITVFLNTAYAIVNMDRDEQSDILRLTQLLLAETIDNDIMNKFLRSISAIPKEERDSFVQKIKAAIPIMMTRDTHQDIMLILYLLPDNSDLKDIDVQNPIWEYHAALITSLEQKLAQELPASTQIRLAKFIEEHAVDLELYEEHPMVQQAVEILLTTNLEGEKNPINIYKKLKRLREIPEDFKPQAHIIGEIPTAINMDGFQGISLQAVKREELPKEATHEAWNLLITSLKTKMEGGDGLPGLPKKIVQVDEKNLEVIAPLWDAFGTTWTELWMKSLQDPELSRLLESSGDKVSLTEAKFRAVLSNILTKDHHPKEDKVFTEQEEVLITTAMSIQGCSGGKKEGIDGAYRDLEDKFHYQIALPGHIQQEEDTNRAVTFVTMVVKNLISSQFSGDNALMRELTGEQGKEIEQEAHQAIYLKNLIGHLVGIDHELAYDRYTGWLYSNLIQKTRKEVLETFFEHVTPKTLVKELMRAVNSDLRKNSVLVYPLITPFEFWDLDEEDSVTLRLNKQGALKLLQIAGFLTQD